MAGGNGGEDQGDAEVSFDEIRSSSLVADARSPSVAGPAIGRAKYLLRGLAAVELLARWYIVATMLVVLAFTFGQVLDRYIFKSSFDAYDQLARIGLVWTTFIGTAMGFRERRTIRVDLIDSILPQRLVRVKEAVFDLVILFLVVMIHVKGWRVVEVGAYQNIIGTPFTYAVSYIALLAGTVLLAAFVLLRFAVLLGVPVPDSSAAEADPAHAGVVLGGGDD